MTCRRSIVTIRPQTRVSWQTQERTCPLRQGRGPAGRQRRRRRWHGRAGGLRIRRVGRRGAPKRKSLTAGIRSSFFRNLQDYATTDSSDSFKELFISFQQKIIMFRNKISKFSVDLPPYLNFYVCRMRTIRRVRDRGAATM